MEEKVAIRAGPSTHGLGLLQIPDAIWRCHPHRRIEVPPPLFFFKWYPEREKIGMVGGRETAK